MQRIDPNRRVTKPGKQRAVSLPNHQSFVVVRQIATVPQSDFGKGRHSLLLQLPLRLADLI
jgi:hypothetical protein